MRLKNSSPREVFNALVSAAQLDEKICDDEWSRYFHYHEKWSDDEKMIKYSNGSGDEMFIFLKKDGIIIKGFAHESEVSPYSRSDMSVWPGMYEGAPKHLLSCLDDEAIEKDIVTGAIPKYRTLCLELYPHETGCVKNSLDSK